MQRSLLLMRMAFSFPMAKSRAGGTLEEATTPQSRQKNLSFRVSMRKVCNIVIASK
jgi:hypothetical protein